jgi:hypothetical protein
VKFSLGRPRAIGILELSVINASLVLVIVLVISVPNVGVFVYACLLLFEFYLCKHEKSYLDAKITDDD